MATWDDLGPEARVLRDVMRSRAFGAVSGDSWFAERGRAGGDAFVCADPAVRHAADFERRLRRRSTQYR